MDDGRVPEAGFRGGFRLHHPPSHPRGRAQPLRHPDNRSSPLSPARSNALAPRHRCCVRRPGRARPDALRRDHDAEARPDRPGQPAGQVHHGLVPQGLHGRLACAAGRRLQRHDARLGRRPRAPGRQLQRVRQPGRRGLPVRRSSRSLPLLSSPQLRPVAIHAHSAAIPRLPRRFPDAAARPLAGPRASATSRARRATRSARRRSRASRSLSSATWRS